MTISTTGRVQFFSGGGAAQTSDMSQFRGAAPTTSQEYVRLEEAEHVCKALFSLVKNRLQVASQNYQRSWQEWEDFKAHDPDTQRRLFNERESAKSQLQELQRQRQ